MREEREGGGKDVRYVACYTPRWTAKDEWDSCPQSRRRRIERQELSLSCEVPRGRTLL